MHPTFIGIQSSPARGTLPNRLADYTMDETDKHYGKVMTVSHISVSKDGKTMTVESSDKQRGATMTYTAEKIP